jgi:hypothetical protein
MTKQISPKTEMTRKMEAFIADRTRNCDLVLPNGDRIHFVLPNSFGRGYIDWFVGDVRWTADLKKNDPRHVACVKQERLTDEAVIQGKQHILKTLKEQRHREWRTLRWNDLKAINETIDATANWLLDRGLPA